MKMIKEGWIKIHRSILDWEWWDDHNTSRLFICILLSANHADNKWKGIPVARGQLITSISKLGALTGLSDKSVRFAINKLKKTGEINIIGTNKYTIITICNYDAYQVDEEIKGKQKGKRGANKEQTKGEQGATNKNEKNEKNEKNTYEVIPPKLEILKNRMQERGIDSFTAEDFIAHYTSNGWKVGKNHMVNWDAALTTWVKNKKNNTNGTSRQADSRSPKRVNQYWD